MLPRLFLVLLLMIPAPALAERRVALVLASEDYRHLRPLANPVTDALAVEDLLAGLGFEVTVETDRDLRRMRRALDDFREDGAGADVALVFYAGHGVEIAGVNYLLPVDAEAGSAAAVAATGLPLAEVQAALSAVAPVGIVLLDACREDPWGTGATGEGRSAVALDDAVDAPKPGLGRIGRADGVLFAFSAAPGEVAADGSGKDSPFTEALLRHFATPGVEVRTALTLVQQDVYDRSRGKQLPYIESGLPVLFFAKADAALDERDRLLIAMAGLTPELRGEIEALALQKDMPLAPLYGALMSADLAGKDKGTRAQALADSAQSFLRFREQVQQLSGEDPQVAELRVRAEKALDLGSFDLAREALDQAVAVDAAARDALRENYRARTVSEAQTHALAASAARADLRYDLALQDLEKALALFAEVEGPELPQVQRAAYTDLLWDQGDLYRLLGWSGKAMASYQAWERIAAARVAEAPDDGEFLRNHAVARVNIGDMMLAQGDLAGAEAEFVAARDVAWRLFDRADAPLKWRHDLFVATSKLGDIAEMRGDLAGALQAQLAGEAVLRKLVAEAPERDDVKRDLALELDRIGDLLQLGGDLTGAVARFEAAKALRGEILARAPGDAAAARDLAGSQQKLGQALLGQAQADKALASFAEAVATLRDLAQKDDSNTALQLDLSYALIGMGDAKAALADAAAAAEFYAEALQRRRDLVATDAANIDWQRSVVTALTRRSDLAFKAQDYVTATPLVIEALAISRKILAANPGVAKYQQDLTAILDRSGDLAMMAGDAAGAQAALLESYELTKTLAAAEPDNADVQLNLVSSLVRVAMFDADRTPRLQEALEVLQRLQSAGRLDPAKQGWIGMVQAMLAQNSAAP